MSMYEQSGDYHYLKSAKKTQAKFDLLNAELSEKTTSKQLRGGNYEEFKNSEFNIDSTTRFNICKL